MAVPDLEFVNRVEITNVRGLAVNGFAVAGPRTPEVLFAQLCDTARTALVEAWKYIRFSERAEYLKQAYDSKLTPATAWRCRGQAEEWYRTIRQIKALEEKETRIGQEITLLHEARRVLTKELRTSVGEIETRLVPIPGGPDVQITRHDVTTVNPIRRQE